MTLIKMIISKARLFVTFHYLCLIQTFFINCFVGLEIGEQVASTVQISRWLDTYISAQCI